MSNAHLDVDMVRQLEERATELAHNLSVVTRQLQERMQLMTNSTTRAGEVYTLAAKNLSREIDDCTSKTVQLITQCDELDKDLGPLLIMAKQIKAIDKALDQLQQTI